MIITSNTMFGKIEFTKMSIGTADVSTDIDNPNDKMFDEFKAGGVKPTPVFVHGRFDKRPKFLKKIDAIAIIRGGVAVNGKNYYAYMVIDSELNAVIYHPLG